MADPFDLALQQEGLSGPLAELARSIYMQESSGGRNTATSNAGAVGGMQIIPATFSRMADQGWDINNPEQNARAGLRYIKRLNELSGGDPMLTAAGYYGGEGAIDKARQGIAISDPRNPNAPNTLQYGKQVTDRLASATMSDANPVGVSNNDPFAELNKKYAISANQTDQQNGQNDPFAELNAKYVMPKSEAYVAPPTPNMGMGDVAFNAVMNLPKSAVKYGSDIVHAITNPISTIGSVLDVGAGALQNALPKPVVDFVNSFSSDPQAAQRAVQAANAVGGEYAKNYGTIEGFKQHLAADPVAVMGDVSALLTGGGSIATKVPGIIGRAGETVANVGRAIDPLNVATKAVTKPLQLAELLATPAVAGLSGTSSSAIRQAATTGRESISDVARGTEKAQAFLNQTLGKAPATDAVQVAREAVDELRKIRSAEYNSGMANIKTDKTILDFTKIDQSLIDADKYAYFKNALKNPEAAKALEDVQAIVDDWKSRPKNEYHTPEGLDNLKQAVGGVLERYKPGTTEYKAVSDVYNAIKKDIVAQAPVYGKVMKDYLEASDTLKELSKSLVSNDRTSSDLTLRKLQSIFRNNVNTNYGSRLEKGKLLEGAGADTLFPMLAGQVFNSPTARGIQGSIAPYAAGGGVVASISNPALWPVIAGTYAASSPRVVGLSSYYGGKAFGAGEKVAKALESYTGKSPIDPYTLRMLAAKLGQMQPEEQR